MYGHSYTADEKSCVFGLRKLKNSPSRSQRNGLPVNDMIQKYIISLPPITKKNSQQILTNHRTGKPFIAPSRQYKKYE